METKEQLEQKIEGLIGKLKNSPMGEKQDRSYELAQASVRYREVTGEYFRIENTDMGKFD